MFSSGEVSLRAWPLPVCQFGLSCKSSNQPIRQLKPLIKLANDPTLRGFTAWWERSVGKKERIGILKLLRFHPLKVNLLPVSAIQIAVAIQRPTPGVDLQMLTREPAREQTRRQPADSLYTAIHAGIK